MKHLAKAPVTTAIIALFALTSLAAAKPPKAATCPACHMTLSKTKDKVHTVKVKTKNGVFYCCSKCSMNQKPSKSKKSK